SGDAGAGGEGAGCGVEPLDVKDAGGGGEIHGEAAAAGRVDNVFRAGRGIIREAMAGGGQTVLRGHAQQIQIAVGKILQNAHGGAEGIVFRVHTIADLVHGVEAGVAHRRALPENFVGIHEDHAFSAVGEVLPQIAAQI